MLTYHIKKLPSYIIIFKVKENFILIPQQYKIKTTKPNHAHNSKGARIKLKKELVIIHHAATHTTPKGARIKLKEIPLTFKNTFTFLVRFFIA